MFVLLFAYVFGGAIAIPGGSYREYLIGGILVQIDRLRDHRPGNLDRHRPDTRGSIDRFRSLPTSPFGLTCVGHLLAELGGRDARGRRDAVSRSRSSAGASHVEPGWPSRAVGLLMLFASAMLWLGTLARA